jgi:hypothetical protein
VQFSNGSTIKNGSTLTIAQAGAQPITLVNFLGNALATPSALNASGNGFSISRTSTSQFALPLSGLGGLPLSIFPGE